MSSLNRNIEKVIQRILQCRANSDPRMAVLAGVSAADTVGYFTPEEWADAANDDITLDQVRRALSTVSGSLSEAVIALRDER